MMSSRRSRSARGFTLLEVVIALGIVGISFGALLQAQAGSLASAARARDLTIATLLARSKIIDVEQRLLDEGFTEGDEQEDGDFADEGFPSVTWQTTVSEIEFDLAGLSSLCEGFGDATEGDAAGCEGMLAGLGAPLDSLTQQIQQNIRAVMVRIGWKDGRYKEGFKITLLVTRQGR